MLLYSTTDRNWRQPLSHCVMEALAPDKGLYMPEKIPVLEATFFERFHTLTFPELCVELAQHWLGGAVEASALKRITETAFDFPVILHEVSKGIYSLELWHGPSLAFKDFGARFMAGLMAYFNEKTEKPLTILVATSGDTGGAVAAGFLDVEGIEVIILYPSGKVSDLQEKQLTTLGKNITACEINGSFDDCQALVKEAFLDGGLKAHYKLSSANSINIARLIPQSFYYFEACRQWQGNGKWVCSVPSGNFGNLTAGLMAKKMGLPIHHFIAATNLNHVVPDYLETGRFEARPSVSTLSNAMDVGNPSNFVRLTELYDGDVNKIRADLSGFWATDNETRTEIKRVYDTCGYIMDPHGAIGHLALRSYLETHGGSGFFLETAHPAKFIDTVETAIGQKPPIPARLLELAEKPKTAHSLGTKYQEFKSFLLSRKSK